MSVVKQIVCTKLAFLTCRVSSAPVNAGGDGIAKSLPQNGSRAHQERGMALAAAVLSVAAENHGGQRG